MRVMKPSSVPLPARQRCYISSCLLPACPLVLTCLSCLSAPSLYSLKRMHAITLRQVDDRAPQFHFYFYLFLRQTDDDIVFFYVYARRMTGLHDIISALSKAIIPVCNSFVLFGFVTLIYATVGVHLFADAPLQVRGRVKLSMENRR